MSNIWEFLLQTATVSLTAGLLLLLKKLFEDKLPPRWQYTIWFLLALRIILPAATQNRYILLPLPVWIETLKCIAEQNLSAGLFGPSIFSAAFDPVHLTSGLPWPAVSAQSSADTFSVTDILFLIYMAGVLFCLLRYAVSYLRLRSLLRRNASEASPEVESLVHEAAEKYNLPTCPIVTLKDLPSAFICGIFRPVLVLPARQTQDIASDVLEKVLLHELLHLKYRDALQSVFWSLLRCLHWCNPFLQSVFNRIGNDMEALCDQRVLERLEGEERREYGRILLEMTNDRYPRAFGTSSLSNGAANIALRIGCIARFKKYPKGMELVSICMAAILLSPLLAGTATNYINDYKLRPLEMDLAISRLERCRTLAGAADTFAKGILTGEVTYIAAASPLEENEYWYERCTELAHSTRIPQDDITEMNPLIGGLQDERGEYYLYNLRPAEDGSAAYHAEYVFPLHWVTMPESEWPEDGMKFYDRSWADPIPGYCIYPVTISEEKSRWQVAQREDFVTGLLPSESADDVPNLHYDAGMLACLAEFSPSCYAASGTMGDITLQNHVYYTVDNETSSNSFFGTQTRIFDNSAKLNAHFNWQEYDRHFLLRFKGSEADRQSVQSITLLAAPLEDADTAADFSAIEERIKESDVHPASPRFSLNSSDGSFAEMRTFGSDEEWNGEISIRGGGGTSYGMKDFLPPSQETSPQAYAVRILINGELAEELILTQGGGNTR